MSDFPTCTHRMLRPIAWNQPKPLPCKMQICECGVNTWCHVCGHGSGSYPCRCPGGTPRWQYPKIGREALGASQENGDE